MVKSTLTGLLSGFCEEGGSKGLKGGAKPLHKGGKEGQMS